MTAGSGKVADQPTAASPKSGGTTSSPDTNGIRPSQTLPADTTPALALTAEPDYLTANSQIIVKWIIERVSLQDYPYLSLQIALPKELSLPADHPGTYDQATRILTIPVSSLSGPVTLITGATVNDAKLHALLADEKKVLAETSLVLPVHEEFVLDKQGGEITAEAGKIKVKIPADTLNAETLIDIGEPGSDEMPVYSLIGQPFEISAKDKKSKTDLHKFTTKIEIEVSYADLAIPEEKLPNLFLYWYNPETKGWEALLSSVDTVTMTLKGKTDHFSVFSVGLNDWQAARMPTVDDFQVSAFTGAATFSLPIEVPAGPGGFEPSLALSYNSQVVDQSTAETQPSWVGMGWSLETGSIEADTGSAPGLMADTYSINVGGVSSRLIHDDYGVYHAADENFWKFDYNSTTKQWTVRDTVGNTYYFGEMANLAYALSCDNDGSPNGGIRTQTYKWVLTRVRNIYGKELVYNYEKETKEIPYEEYSNNQGKCIDGDPKQLSDTAIFPQSIVYPNGRYRVFFRREGRLDYPAGWDTDNAHHSFERTRLKTIYIQYDPNGTGFVDPASDPSQTVRSYQFSYESDTSKVIFPGYTYPVPEGTRETVLNKVSTLSQVQEFGAGGTPPLPPYTFTYGDNLHLTQANNGYGGSVEFDYDHDTDHILLEPWSYTATTKGYTSTQDFESCTDYNWIAGNENSSVLMDCATSDDALSVSGEAIHSALEPRLFRPGGTYRVSTSRGSSAASASIGASDGQADHLSPVQSVSGPMSYEFTLPATSSVLQRLILTSGGALGPYTNFSNFKVELLPSFYRVFEKRVLDGQGHTYIYSYNYTDGRYDTAAVNDENHSSIVCRPGDPADCTSMVEAYTEFRGNGRVTETETSESGAILKYTVTTFDQGDILKGQPLEVSVLDATGKKLTRTVYKRKSPVLPIWFYGNYDYKVGHYWIHPDVTENQVYFNDGIRFSATCTRYTYDESASTNYSYGNLLAQEDQPNGCDSASPTTYRKTTFEYFPNTSAYLVGFPARQQIKNANNTVIADSLNLYDANMGYNVAPTTGKLTAVRTWVDSTLTYGRYNQVTYGYDDWGNQTTVTTYSGYGGALVTPSAGARTTYVCYGTGVSLGGVDCPNDSIHTYPLWSKNPLQQKTTWAYDYLLGVPVTEVDANNNPTYAQYDPLGRIVKLIRPGNGDNTNQPTIAIAYHDGTSFWTEITQRIDDSTTRYQSLRRHYDGMGRPISVEHGSTIVNSTDGTINANSFELDNQTSYSYPASNRVREYVPSISGTTLYTETVSDALGRPKTITAPNQTQTSYTYSGLETTVTDAKLNSTTSKTDGWGRVITVTPPTGPSVGYVYDESDRLVKAIRGSLAEVNNCLSNPSDTNCPVNKTVNLVYDASGRKVSMSDPDMGHWAYAYDALGNLTRQTDAKQQRICLYYDALNRLKGKHYRTNDNCPGTPTYNVTYTYDNGTNGKGQRTGMSDDSGSTAWTYDARGRVTKESKSFNGIQNSFDTYWSYNSADQPATMTYPDGEILTYTYAKGKLYSITNGSGDTYLASMDYDAAGRITNIKYGANILEKQFQYFPWEQATDGGLLNTAVTRRISGSVPLQSLAYSYDDNGNVHRITDGMAGSQIQTFDYDGLNRLISAVTTGGDSFGTYNESYAYNEDTGNLSTKAGMGYTYDPAHPHAVHSLTNGNSYLYDANGNMIERNIEALKFDLAYDVENRLVSVTGSGTLPTPTPLPSATPTVTASPTGTMSATATPTNTPTATSGTPTNPPPTSTPGAGDPYTTALLHMNGADGATAFPDESGAAWTAQGNAQVDTAQAKFGLASLLSDGNTDRITTPHQSAFNINGDFTIDLWARFNVTTGSQLFAYKDDGANGWYLLWSGSNLRFRNFTSSATTIDVSRAWSPAAGQWYHIAVTRSGNDYRIFVDGNQLGAVTTDTDPITNTSTSLAVGGAESGTWSLNGWMDEFRFSNGMARWTGNFTPPASEYSLSTPTATVTPTPAGTMSQTPTFTPPAGTATFTPVPTGTPTQTLTMTPSPTTASSNGAVYLSLDSGGTVGGITADDLDILYFNGSAWSMFFDASDLGISTSGQDINDFHIVDADTLLLTFSNPITLGALAVDPWDIVQFDAASLGDTTAGTFSLYFDGEDVGFDSTGEYIDGLDLLGDGRILVSTTGSSSVAGVSGADEDILAFTPTTLGATTSGAWAMYFDGSDVGLGDSGNEDVDAFEVALSGDIYLSTLVDFAVAGLSGLNEDIFVCTPTSLGDTTACNYSASLYFDGSTYSLDANNVDAINLPTGMAALPLSHFLAENGGGPGGGHFATYQFSPLQQSGTEADTIGVFRSSNYTWYLKNRNDTTGTDVSVSYGLPGDYPVVGDWDGNGTTTLGLYRNGTFYLRNSNAPGFADLVFAFGVSGDQPVAGDWDGDGVDTIGVYHAATGTFLLRNSNEAGEADLGFVLGGSGDVAIAGDWNGDGVDSTGIFRSSNGTFYLSNTNDQGFADIVFAFGVADDKPIAGDWNSDGIDSIGVFRPGNAYFYLRNSNSSGNAELTFPFGNNTDLPVAGNWDGQPTVLPPTPTPTTPPGTPAPVNASFTYDGDGKRVKSTINDTTTYFVGAHYERTGSTITKYYFAGTQRIAMRTYSIPQNSTVNYLISDHLGSTSLMTDASGEIVSQIRYKPWGEVLSSSGTTPTEYTYTGQYSDSYINLLDYGSRRYDPELGRFIQPDSIVPDPYNPQDWNRYAYARNNPVRYSDPDGHKPCEYIGCTVFQNNLTGGLAKRDMNILTAIIAMESSSGNVPNDVNYMKAWSLLNARSYNQANGNFYANAIVDWKHHERDLLDSLGITGTIEEQEAAILKWYEGAANGEKSIKPEDLAGLESSVTKAVNDWALYGSNSSADPVHGATGFVDASGLCYPTGACSKHGGEWQHFGDMPNYYAVSTDVDHSELETWRTNIYPNSSRIYSNGIYPYTGLKMYTFTWFEQPSYPWP